MSVTRKDFTVLNSLEPEESGLLGTLYVFGTPYHFHFVEVKELPSGGYEPVNDPHNRLADAESLYLQPLMLTEIEGKTYIGFAHPHGD